LFTHMLYNFGRIIKSLGVYEPFASVEGRRLAQLSDRYGPRGSIAIVPAKTTPGDAVGLRYGQEKLDPGMPYIFRPIEDALMREYTNAEIEERFNIGKNKLEICHFRLVG